MFSTSLKLVFLLLLCQNESGQSIPDIPTNLRAMAIGARIIRVEWDHSGLGFSSAGGFTIPPNGFTIEVNTPMGPRNIVRMCYASGVNTRSYLVLGLTPYSYNSSQGVNSSVRIRATDPNGDSAYTAYTAPITLPPCPGTCDYHFYTIDLSSCGIPSRCVCNPSYSGPPSCNIPNFTPGNVSVTFTVQADGDTPTLAVQWDQPGPMTLDGRILVNFTVTVFALQPNNTRGQILTQSFVPNPDARGRNSRVIGDTIFTSTYRIFNYAVTVTTVTDVIQDFATSPEFLVATHTPGPVLNLVSTATSDSVTFSWMAPVDANGLLLRYIVDIISSTSIGSAGTGSFIISPSAESFSLSGSNPNIVYFFTIAASNSLGVGVTVPLSTTTEPLDCSANFFANGAQCSLCPNNSASLQGSQSITDCLCSRGYEQQNASETCSPCSFGTYKNSTGDSECTSCPALLTTTITAATNESACDTCRYSEGTYPEDACYYFNTTLPLSVTNRPYLLRTRFQLSWAPVPSSVEAYDKNEAISSAILHSVMGFRITCASTGRGVVSMSYAFNLAKDFTTEPGPTLIMTSDLQRFAEYTCNTTLWAAIDGGMNAFGPPSSVTFVTRSNNDPAEIRSAIATTNSAVTVVYSVHSLLIDLIADLSLVYYYTSNSQSSISLPFTLPPQAVGIFIIPNLLPNETIELYINATVGVDDAPSTYTSTPVSVDIITAPDITTTINPDDNTTADLPTDFVPGPPVDVRVVEILGNFINVTWRSPSTNGVVTGYKVVVTSNGQSRSITYENDTFFALLPKPASSYTVTVQALSSAGTGPSAMATTDAVTTAVGGSTLSTSPLFTLIISVAAGGGGALLICLVLILICSCCCCIRCKRNRGHADILLKSNDYNNEHVYTSRRLPAILPMHVTVESKDGFAPHSLAFVNPTISDETGVTNEMGAQELEYAEISSRDRKMIRETSEPALISVAVKKEATPDDYGNEELYMEMAKIYFEDVVQSNHLAAYEIDRSRLDIIEEVGHGEFGRVMKAKAEHVVPGQASSIVAVKMLKDDADEKTKKNFLGEAQLLAKFGSHPNVMGLLKVVCQSDPQLVIISYMPHGDLKQYLRKCADENQPNYSVDTTDQLHIGEQIAAGMEYLAGKFFIHRDLAARNVLVGKNNSVKISDFGLSRTLGKDDSYYKLSQTAKMPVKWMALESLLYQKFSTYSDVWSFGVVLWEIFSFGVSPYKGIKAMNITRHVQQGNRLSCPEGCPQEVHQMMKECWNATKEQRPTFTQLKLQLKALAIKQNREQSLAPGSEESELYTDMMGNSNRIDHYM